MNQSIKTCALSIALLAAINGCAASTFNASPPDGEPLAGCPNRPNCVSSEAGDPKHAVAPLRLKGDFPRAWQEICGIVAALPRTAIVHKTETYLHAECRSRLFRFVDDLELRLDPETGRIAVRSAARSGYSDLGVNRRRVENLRRQIAEKGWALP